MRTRWTYAPLMLLAPIAAAAQEQKRQPPPEFTSGYQPPSVFSPGPRPEVFGWIDVAVLAGVLLLAAYFLLARRSRREVRLLSLFSLLYFGFYRLGCVCSVGSIQNVALALGHNGYVLPFTVGAFFLLPLVAALFFGRVFCAAACPLGVMQDLLLLRKPKRVPHAVDQALSVVPYVYLGVAVLFAATGTMFLICRYDPFVPFYRMAGGGGIVAFGVVMLALATTVGRPYCRWLCPYGVLLRWLAPFARWRVRITPSECIRCHLCADACPFGAIRPPSVEDAGAKRVEGRALLSRLVLLTPALVAAGALLGYLSAPVLARSNSTVALAQRVWLEENGRVRGTTDPSTAFRDQGRRPGDLYREAVVIRRRFLIGGTLLGAWIGLVIGLRQVLLTLRRRRDDYEADAAACVSCGRCYASCPVEHERLLAQAEGRETRPVTLESITQSETQV